MRLMKFHAKCTKNMEQQKVLVAPDRYQYLMSLINNLQKDYRIPISVFNSP
jgi:hypothetical protein